jgi:hypothetical protein
MMQNTIRKMTGRLTPQQMSDAQINTYLNLFLTLQFPLHFKNLKLTKPYVFNTVPNVDTYDFIYEDHPTNPLTGQQSISTPGNIQISPPAYCQGYLLRYYQDKSSFFNRWPKLSVNQIINSGNGTSGPYTGYISTTPFLRAEQDIFGNVTIANVTISSFDNSGFNLSLTDDPQPNNNIGNLVDTNGMNVGTVNYLTGQYTFTLNGGATIPAGDNIYAAVVPIQTSRPTDVLFYNQQIIFRPVPMQVYQVEFQISQQPTQLIEAGAAPELDEWYLFVCAGASRLIYNDFPDAEGRQYADNVFQEQLQIAQRRTLRQLGTQRAQTIFSAPGWGRNWGTYFYGSEYSGSQ